MAFVSGVSLFLWEEPLTRKACSTDEALLVLNIKGYDEDNQKSTKSALQKPYMMKIFSFEKGVLLLRSTDDVHDCLYEAISKTGDFSDTTALSLATQVSECIMRSFRFHPFEGLVFNFLERLVFVADIVGFDHDQGRLHGSPNNLYDEHCIVDDISIAQENLDLKLNGYYCNNFFFNPLDAKVTEAFEYNGRKIGIVSVRPVIPVYTQQSFGDFDVSSAYLGSEMESYLAEQWSYIANQAQSINSMYAGILPACQNYTRPKVEDVSCLLKALREHASEEFEPHDGLQNGFGMPLLPISKATLKLKQLKDNGDSFCCQEEHVGDNQMCSICLDDWSAGGVVTEMALCQHLFHKRCLLKWLVKSQTCPYCRTSCVAADVAI